MRLLLILACLLGASRAEDRGPAPSPPIPHAFWIWNHQGQLSGDLVLELRRHRIDRIYHHLHELEPGGTWKPLRSTLPAGHEIPGRVTVVRLPPDPAWLTHPNGLPAIPQRRKGDDPAEVQIDFDCPASRLADYAAAITRLRAGGGIRSVSVTALASWIDAPDFGKLAAAADEIVPMFYDLETDDPAAVRAGRFEPLIGAETLDWIAKWRRCPRPWRAGLPNFQRLSIFGPDGKLAGHHPRFDPGMLLASTHLSIDLPAAAGCATFTVDSAGPLAGVELSPGQRIVWRFPDDRLLRQAVETSMRAGAGGIVWFAHPVSAPTAWHSVPHLLRIDSPPAEPVLEVSIADDGGIVLANTGDTDLTPRPDGQPWQLVLEDKPGAFRRSHPGTFHALESAGTATHRLDLASSIRLSFHQLHAGTSLRSGARLTTLSQPPPWSLNPAP